MTALLATLGGGASLCLGGLLLCLWKIGCFRKVTFQRRTIEPFVLVYRQYMGSLSSIGPVFGAAEAAVQTLGLECLLAGVYFDDPKATPAEKCRAFVGVRLPGLSALTDELRERLAEKGFGCVREYPAATCEVADWPLCPGILHVPSILAAVSRVYPAGERLFCEGKGGMEDGAVLELYEGERMLHVCFPLDSTSISAKHWNDQ